MKDNKERLDVQKGEKDMEKGQPEKVSPISKNFPTPKYVFSIYAPKVIIIDETSSEDRQNLAKSIWKDYASVRPSDHSTSSTLKKKKLRVKLLTLIIKRLNRMIRDEFIPREAIQCTLANTHVFVQILIAPSALPILISKFEYIGVGNVVGMCFAAPIETSAVPPPGPIIKEIDLMAIESSVDGKKSIEKTDTETAATSLSTKTGDDANESDADSGSSVEEEDDEKETDYEEKQSSGKGSFLDSVNVPALSKGRMKDLRQMVIDGRKEWLETASRIRVEQVKEELTAAAAFTWDYIAFVLCASTIAAAGLATDSAVTTLASMLVSPIMGPVMGFTFGTTIRSKSMVLKSLRNELLSLLICLVMGIFWGFIVAVANVDGRRDWPSAEMVNRGDPTGLISGIVIAIPSGVATALSTLGRNSSGLVGVAISLSLLPPAVNAGMCLMYAAVLQSDFVDRNEGDDEDYWELGLISFGLTLVNILCIWLAGVFTFWLKEVSIVDKKNAFWSRDIKVYRQQGDEMPEANLEAINEGMQAALVLGQVAGNQIYEGDFDISLDERKVADARRRGLAANALEDALFVDGDFGLDNKVVPGGAADTLLDEDKLENIKRKKTVSASFVQTADHFGGLGNAGEALFDDRIFAKNSAFDDGVFLPSDTGIMHEDVANQILFQDLQ